MMYLNHKRNQSPKRVKICLISVHFLEQIDESRESGFHVLGEYMSKVENLAYFYVFCHISDEKRTEEMDSIRKHGLCRNHIIQ